MKRILVEKNLFFTRIGVLQENEWLRFYMVSHLEEDLQDRIVVGQVQSIVKNLKAAFIDYGEEKNGMLHLKQLPEQYGGNLQQGMRLAVQVVKQNVGEKGHKLTGKINLKGRYLVCLPFEKGIFVSKKIKSEQKRLELKAALEVLSEETFGFIVRTHAEKVSLKAVKRDAEALIRQAEKLMETKDYLSKGTLLHEEMPLYETIIAEEIDKAGELEILCNDAAVCVSLESWAKEEEGFKVRRFEATEDLWSLMGLEKAFENLFARKIWLKNGGNLMIDYTEAMTVIDVNSAKAVLTKNNQKAVYQLNELAVKEGILQMLRRNLAGMIIMDLVEMKSTEDKEAIYEFAKKWLLSCGDSHTKVYPLTELGLLQFSRPKEHVSLQHQMFTDCSACHTPYHEKSVQYGLFYLEKYIKKVKTDTIHERIEVTLDKRLYDYMTAHKLGEALKERYGITLDLKSVTQMTNKLFLCQFYG